MKKLALTCLMLLLVICGCGKTYSLHEQQAEFQSWYQNFDKKAMDAANIGNEQKDLLLKLQSNQITQEDADAQFKQLDQEFTQALSAFDQPPEIKTLSKEDQQTLKDCYKDMHTGLGYLQKVVNDGREAMKSPTPQTQQTLLDDKNKMEDIMNKVQDNLKRVGKKLNIQIG